MNPPLLSAEGLTVRLGDRMVLGGVDIRFDTGWTAVVGPNGAGKSTLLRALAGLLPLQGGRVMLQGQALSALPRAAQAQRLGWLAQQGEVTGDLTVQETVALGRLAHQGGKPSAWLKAPDAVDTAAVAQAMADTECSAFAQRRLLSLSGGERQRVLLARVLATGCPVLLLDEPTTHLDAPHQVALARLFRQLATDSAAPARAVVTVLHDLPIALLADHIVVMQQGQIAAVGGSRDPAVHRVLEAVFDHAIQVDCLPGQAPRVSLNLGV